MSTTALDAIQLAASNNPSQFRDAIDALLFDKIKERLSVEKIAVAQKFFNEPSGVETEEEETANEDL